MKDGQMDPRDGGHMTPAASSHAEGEGALCTVMMQSPLAKGDTFSAMGKEGVACCFEQDEKEVTQPIHQSLTSHVDNEDSETNCDVETLPCTKVMPSVDHTMTTQATCCESEIKNKDLKDKLSSQADGSGTHVAPHANPKLSEQSYTNNEINSQVKQNRAATIPYWLQGLLKAELFVQCEAHAMLRRNETNFFCLACTPSTGKGICRHCVHEHSRLCSRKMFQIRRYMYQCVVHADELGPYFDLTGVQAYCINSRRAVLIHPKPPPPTASSQPAFSTKCQGCDVPLRPDCSYCSVRCKVDVVYDLQPATPGAGCAAPEHMRQDSYVSNGLSNVVAVRTPQKWNRSYNSLSSTAFQISIGGTNSYRTQDICCSPISGSKRRKISFPMRSYFS